MCLLTLGSAKKIMPYKNKRSIKDFMCILYLKHIRFSLHNFHLRVTGIAEYFLFIESKRCSSADSK